MGVRATTWAWGQELPASEKLLLLAIADQANNEGVLLHAPQTGLVKATGSSVRTVRTNLGKLEDRGLLRRYVQYEEGWRMPDLMVLPVEGTLNLPANIAGSGKSCRAVSSSTTSLPEDSFGSSEESEKKEQRTARQILPVEAKDVPDAMRADAEELLKRRVKVAERVVTGDEMVRAAAALAEFNRQAGTDYGLGANLRAIVMRARERPSWDVAKHVRLVQSAFRFRWWEREGRVRSTRRVSPSVIWGNERCFENVVQDATTEAQGKRKGRFDRRVIREGDDERLG